MCASNVAQHGTRDTCALRFPAVESRSTVGTHETEAACLLYLPFATGDKWVVCKSTVSKMCGSDRHTLRGDIVARMRWARQAAATFKWGQTKK